MRSLLKIIKQAGAAAEEKVLIPDLPLYVPPAAVEADGAGPPSPGAVPSGMMYDSMVQRAREEGETLSKRLMELAHREREEILAQARADAELIKQEACQTGLAQGAQAKKEEIDSLLREMDRAMGEVKLQHQAFLDEYTAKLGELSLDVAEKILHHQLDRDEAAMADLVREAVAGIKNVDWLTVQLSRQMTGLLDRLHQMIPPVDPVDGRRIDIQGKELPAGSCIIETPVGQVDASISTQLDNLRSYFKQV